MSSYDERTLDATTASTAVASSSQSHPAGTIALPERYEIIRTLGQGGFGVVYLAKDHVLGQEVAVKVLLAKDATLAARVRREVSALRLLQIPGVVGILDDQPLAGGHLLVMEFVEGEPFPSTARDDYGGLRARTWELLETLGRVHATGVVHRDLKPSNILVTREGRVIVLDFGIAAGDAVEDEQLTRSGNFIGTFRYAAPEQLRGGAVDARSDLYAVGCILREHVTQESSFGEISVADALRRRLTTELEPVRERVPGLPKPLAELIDRLLAREPSARPRHAGAALRLLSDSRAALEPTSRPWFGPRDAVEALVRELHLGHAASLVGPRGSGRTRTLQEVSRELEALGHDVIWLPRGGRPLSSLRWWLEIDIPPQLRLAEALSLVRDAIQVRLDRGAVIIIDGDGVDEASLQALRCVNGAVVVATAQGASWGGIIHVDKVRPVHIEPLFAGPERLLHRRSLAAARLWSLGRRYPGHLVSTLESAMDAGAAEVDGEGLYTLSRNFEMIASARASRPDAATDHASLSMVRRELLEWADAMASNTTVELAAASLERPLWEVDADVSALCRLGLMSVRRGRMSSLVDTDGTMHWTERRRRTVLASLGRSLPDGAPDRLRLLVLGEDLERALEEGIYVARAHLSEGRGAECLAVMRTTLAAAVGTRMSNDVARVYAELVTTAAVEEATIAAFDVGLYELNRLETLSAGGVPLISRGVQLLRLLRRSWQSIDERLLEDLDSLGRFDEESLELARQGARLRVARNANRETLSAVMADLQAFRSTAMRSTAAAVDGLESIQAYREGRWKEAMKLSARAARGAGTWARAARCWVTAGAAALEAFELMRASRFAHSALVAARRVGHALLEGNAEWVARTALYRSEQYLAVDLELIEASREVGSPDLEAQVCTTEAAIAFRNGELATAAKLARRIVTLWGATGRADEAALYEGLAWACEPVPDVAARARLIEHACRSTVPGMGIQLLGLLQADVPAEVANSQAGQISRLVWQRRLDILSVDESLARLRGS